MKSAIDESSNLSIIEKSNSLPSIPLEEVVQLALEQQRVRMLKQVGESCIHSRNIIALLDLSEKVDEFKSFTTHLENCFECQDQLAKAKNLQGILDFNIPLYMPDEESLETFKEELKELFKNLIVTPPTRAQKSLMFGNRVLEDLISTLLQPQIIFTFFVSIVAGSLIKYFS